MSSNAEAASGSGCGKTLVLGLPGQLAQCVVGVLAELGEPMCLLIPTDFDEANLPEATFYRGDWTSIDLGLPGADYLELAAQAQRVIYAVASCETTESLERSSAVRGAMELLELTRAGAGNGGVVFSSSLLCLGTPKQPVMEGAFQINQSFPSRYEESLAVAEKIARRVARYRPLSVVRSAPVAGNAATGQLDPRSPLAHLARRIQSWNLSSEISYRDEPVRFETADRLAEALVRLWKHPVATTLHLCDEVALTDRMLVDFLIDRVGKVGDSAAMVPFRTKVSLPHVPASQTVLGWPARFDRTQAKSLLGDVLDRDPFSVLEAFFPAKASSEAAGEGSSGQRGDLISGAGKAPPSAV